MSSSGKRYSREFKLEVIRRVRETGRTQAQVNQCVDQQKEFKVARPSTLEFVDHRYPRLGEAVHLDQRVDGFFEADGPADQALRLESACTDHGQHLGIPVCLHAVAAHDFQFVQHDAVHGHRC